MASWMASAEMAGDLLAAPFPVDAALALGLSGWAASQLISLFHLVRQELLALGLVARPVDDLNEDEKGPLDVLPPSNLGLGDLLQDGLMG